MVVSFAKITGARRAARDGSLSESLAKPIYVILLWFAIPDIMLSSHLCRKLSYRTTLNDPIIPASRCSAM